MKAGDVKARDVEARDLEARFVVATTAEANAVKVTAVRANAVKANAVKANAVKVNAVKARDGDDLVAVGWPASALNTGTVETSSSAAHRTAQLLGKAVTLATQVPAT